MAIRAFLAASCAMMLCAGCAGPLNPSSMTLVLASSTWKYLDNGSNQGTSWRELTFDDSSWPSGTAPLAALPDGDRRAANTKLNSGPFNAQAITYYFRQSFTISNPAALENLTLLLRRHDGAIVYLNGTEVARSNMPPGPADYLTLSTGKGTDEGLTWWEFPVSRTLLTAGRNVIAAEVHRDDPYSSDIIFDLQLLGTDTSNHLMAPSAVRRIDFEAGAFAG